MSIIIGTLSHEGGHCLLAILLGYSIEIDYHSMDYYGKTSAISIPLAHHLIITIGGIVATIFTSVIAFFYLLKRKEIINFSFWILFFISLFISRQVINLVLSLIGKVFFNRNNYFGGDEFYLSTNLNLPSGFFSIVLFLFAFYICFRLLFEILPKQYRFAFFISSIIGGVGGYYLWFQIIGKIMLPPIS